MRVRLCLVALVAISATGLIAACSNDEPEDATRPARTITPFVPRSPEATPPPTPGPFRTPAPLATPVPPEDASIVLDAQVRSLLYLITETVAAHERSAVLRAMRERNDPRFVVPLIHVWAFSPAEQRPEVAETVEAIAGTQAGHETDHWFFGWYQWMAEHPEWPMPDGYANWAARLIEHRRGVDFHRFLRSDRPSRIRPELILWSGRPPDGVPPISQPEFVPASEATDLLDDEVVFGVQVDGETRAYPLRIVGWHEIVNDRFAGNRVMLSYCPLSDSGILYATSGDAGEWTFGNSGLVYESGRLLYDHQSNTLWTHATGEPVMGRLAESGIRLAQLPMVRTTWSEWRTSHPDTLVLSGEAGHTRAYEPGTLHEQYLASEALNFPVFQLDDALAPKERVYGLLADGATRAFPIDVLPPGTVINDAIGMTPVVLVVDAGGGVRAYQRNGHEFRPGNLRASDGPLTLLDASGAAWRIHEGELVSETGAVRPRFAGHRSFWFSWHAFRPGTTLYGVD